MTDFRFRVIPRGILVATTLAIAAAVPCPAFTQDTPSEHVRMVAEYPSNGLLMSGWMLGERTIAGRAAVVEAVVGKGRVVLLGFRTRHRGQPHGTYKLLFNSMLLGASSR